MYNISGRKIVVVKHTYYDSSGTPDAELIEFLKGKADTILDILHPFPDAGTIPPNTRIREYDPSGGIRRDTTAPAVGGGDLVSYCKDVLFTVFYVFRSGRIYDLYIGADNLNTLAGILLRMLGRVRKVVYYVIDFTPVRFGNRFMNAVYQAVNKVCCYHSDAVWNVSEVMVRGREEIGIRRNLSAPQITVPLGCAFRSIPRKKDDEVNRKEIVYFGSLREEHGPGLILESLPEIMEAEPGVGVVFVGDGELRERLEERAAELEVSSCVRFTGYIDSGEEVYRLLSSSGLALATYPPGDRTYKMFSDPGKVKIYLACGLPVLMTDVPPIAAVIRERGAGRIVSYDPPSLARAVIDILGNPAEYRRMRKSAVSLAAEYDWEAIWTKTFESMDL